MTNEEYIINMEMLKFISSVATQIDIDSMLERIDEADALGPIIDPTLWIKTTDKVASIKRLLATLREFQDVVEVERKILTAPIDDE